MATASSPARGGASTFGNENLKRAGIGGLALAFRIISPVFILVALLLIGGAVNQWFLLVLPMWTTVLSPVYCVATSVGIFFIFNIVYNYAKCITVSSVYAHPDGDECGDGEADDDFRFCKHCKHVTPEDSQHCFLCGQCVYDLDHHCPWIMNCVGRHNHSYFFLFLFYVTTGCLFFSGFSVPPFYSLHFRHRKFSKYQPKHLDHGMLSLSAILPLTLSVAVGAMMVWHGYLLATCQTSLEFPNNFWKKYKAYKLGNSWTHLKDRGIVRNWQTRFGVSGERLWWILWLFPYLRTKKRGEEYRYKELRKPRTV